MKIFKVFNVIFLTALFICGLCLPTLAVAGSYGDVKEIFGSISIFATLFVTASYLLAHYPQNRKKTGKFFPAVYAAAENSVAGVDMVFDSIEKSSKRVRDFISSRYRYDSHDNWRYQIGAIGSIDHALQQARGRTSSHRHRRHSETAASSSSGDSGDSDSDGGDGDSDSSDEPQSKKNYVVDLEKEKQFLEEQFSNPELLIRLENINHSKAFLVNLSGFFKNPGEFYKTIQCLPWYADHDLQIICRLNRYRKLQPELFEKRHELILGKIIIDGYTRHRSVICRFITKIGVGDPDLNAVAYGLFVLFINKVTEKNDFFTRPNPHIITIIRKYVRNGTQALIESGVGGDFDANKLRKVVSDKTLSEDEKDYYKTVSKNARSMAGLHIIDREDGESGEESMLDLDETAGELYSSLCYDHDYTSLDTAHTDERYEQLETIPAFHELDDCVKIASTKKPNRSNVGLGIAALLETCLEKDYFRSYDNVRFFFESVKSGYLQILCREYGIESKITTEGNFVKSLADAAKRIKDEGVKNIILTAVEYARDKLSIADVIKFIDESLDECHFVNWSVSDEEARRIELETKESIQNFVDALIDELLSADDQPDPDGPNGGVSAPSAVDVATVEPVLVEAGTAPVPALAAALTGAPSAAPTPALPPLEPPFIWLGGKRKIAHRINEILPPPSANQSYIEPFAGGLAVLLSRPPAGIEVANDADGDVINFFQVLRDHGEELREYLRNMPYHRHLFDSLKYPPDKPLPPLERASRFFYLARSSFGGEVQGRIPRWAYAKAHDSKPRAMFNAVENDLLLVRDRLRLVYFESDSALNVIRRYDSENAVFYCDPPYMPDTRRDGNYAFEMSVSDHEDLLLTLLDVKGKVALSGYPSDLYQDLLRDWDFADIGYSCKINNNFDLSDESRRRVERVWMNPPLADDYRRRRSKKQQVLFDFEDPDPPVPQPNRSPSGPRLEMML